MSEIGRIYRVRLDDAENPDALLEMTVELDTEPVIVGKPLDDAA